MIANTFPWRGHVWRVGEGCLSFYCFLCFAEVFRLDTAFSICLHLLPLCFWFHIQGDQCQTPCPLDFLKKVLQFIPSPRWMSPEGVSWSKGLRCAAEKKGTDPCLAAPPSFTHWAQHSSRICSSRTQKPSLASQRPGRARKVHCVSLGKGLKFQGSQVARKRKRKK